MTTLTRRVVGLGLLLGSWLSAGAAHAQSCCTSTGSNEFGVVPRGRTASIASQLSWDRGFGSFTSDGRYHLLANAEADDIVWRWGGGFRPGLSWLQLHVSLPVKLQYRSLSGVDSATRIGFGDAQAGLRATLTEDRIAPFALRDASTWLPFLEPFVGLRAPTGRAPERSTTPTQADVMGDGAWLFFAGLSVTKYLSDDEAITLAGTWGHRFARSVPGVAGAVHRFEPGNEYDARVSWQHFMGLFWSTAIFGELRITEPPRSDGEKIANGGTRRVRLGMSALYYLSYPAWQLVPTLALDLPLNGLGKNVPFAGSSLSLSLQRNFS